VWSSCGGRAIDHACASIPVRVRLSACRARDLEGALQHLVATGATAHDRRSHAHVDWQADALELAAIGVARVMPQALACELAAREGALRATRVLRATAEPREIA
jgi:hypothetical protein